MKSRTSNIVLFGMVIGAILGVLGGYFFGNILIHIKFIGTIFLNALKMVVIPLVIASLIVGVTSLGDIRKLGRTAGKTLIYYLTTTSFSVLIGIILVNLISPGKGVPAIGAAIPEFVQDTGGNTVIDVIVRLIPDNIVAAAADGRILPLIVFSLIFGGVLTTIGSKGRPIITLFEGINAAIMKIVMLIIYFAPIGVFALIGGIVAEHRESVDELLSALGLYSLTVLIGLLIHAVIVLPLILKFFGRKKPLEYFLNMGRALATAFTTASSSATLPLTMEAVEVENKVDKKASSFVLPLGATINMDGTALYEAVAAIFIAQIYGIDLSIGAQVVIFFTATLASIGAAAIPEAGLVMMSLVLTAVGLPLEGIGIILAIDWFLDRCRTTVNVWGDSVGAAVIGETAEIKTYLTPATPVKKKTTKSRPDSKTRPQKQTRTSRGIRTETRKKGPKAPNGRKYDKHRGETTPRQEKSSRYKKNGYRQRSDHNGRNSKFGKGTPVAASIQPGKPKTKPVDPKPETLTGPGADSIPHDTINKEIEKVRQQLASMSDEKLESSTDDTPDQAAMKVKSDNEKYFDIEFSKINFFGDQERESHSSDDTIETEDVFPSINIDKEDKKENEEIEEKVEKEEPGLIPVQPESEPVKLPEMENETETASTSEIIDKPEKGPETETQKKEDSVSDEDNIPVKAAVTDNNGGDEEKDSWGREKKKRPSR